MSTSNDTHRVAPILRALCVLVGLVSAAFALLFGWLAMIPDSAVDWGERLVGLGLTAAFGMAAWVFAVSAARGRSPDRVPVRAPWRTVAEGLRSAVLFVAAIAGIEFLKPRVGPWIAYGVGAVLAAVVGLWTQQHPPTQAGRSDGSSR